MTERLSFPFPHNLLVGITDDADPAEVVRRKAQAACRAGCHILQLRMRRSAAGELFRLAETLRRVTSDCGALLIVNDRLDVAMAVGADGVHLPATGVAPARARDLLGSEFLLGRSVHSPQEIIQLRNEPLDYLQFGPVFETASKVPYGPPQGLQRLRQAVEAAHGRPVVAVGGIVAAAVERVMACGATGVAVIGAIMSAREIAEATNEFLEGLRRARSDRPLSRDRGNRSV